MTFETYSTPPALCPRCGHSLNMAAAPAWPDAPPRAPEAGDLTLCMACGQWLVFDRELKIRALDRDLRIQLKSENQTAYERVKLLEEEWKRSGIGKAIRRRDRLRNVGREN